MTPQERQLPGAWPTTLRRNAVDERILAQRAQHSLTEEEQEGSGERDCFYPLEGWVFLGSLGHDGEEVVEAIRCRRRSGRGWIGS